MVCSFCGRNFEPVEGFEEFKRHGHHLVRCEECIWEWREEEYNWKTEMRARGSRGTRARTILD